jgi:hypothetical protein
VGALSIVFIGQMHAFLADQTEKMQRCQEKHSPREILIRRVTL